MSHSGQNGKGTIWDQLPEKLSRILGEGSDPNKRRALYSRLRDACRQHGDQAYRQIATVLAESASARNRERYFCHSVLLRLQEHQLLPFEDFLGLDK